MQAWTVGQLASAAQGRLLRGDAAHMITAICTDTRKITHGAAFVALKGQNFDGHDYVNQAIAAGASCVIVVQGSVTSVNENASVIEVEDTLRAFQCIAHCYRMRFVFPVVAVTGSNGKTTTKDMIAAVLETTYNTLKTHANFNNEIGLPLTLLQLESTHEVAVVEMGMRGRGEIKELAQIACPTIGVVTNVGPTHIELLGSIENIAEAKGELVESIGQSGMVFLNADDSLVMAMAKRTEAAVTTYGIHNGDVRAENILMTNNGVTFTLITEKMSFMVELPVAGKHNVYNALAAAAVGLHLGLGKEAIAQGLAGLRVTAMRMEVIPLPNDARLINDAYNASPLSTKAALETLRGMSAQRHIAVLGDMFELGDYTREAHLLVGRQVAELGIHYVLAVGDAARYIVQGAVEGGLEPTKVFHCGIHQQAIEWLKENVQPGDVILVKGSRGMKMEQIATALAEIS